MRSARVFAHGETVGALPKSHPEVNPPEPPSAVISAQRSRKNEDPITGLYVKGTPIEPGFDAHLLPKSSRGIEDIYELTYIRKDGSRLPAVVSVTALRDTRDSIIGYLLIGTDNTLRNRFESERKLLDQRLRDQQFYTRSLIESNIDALIATDPAGIISDVNKQMEALTGCTRDELIGAARPRDYFHRCRAELEQASNVRFLKSNLINYELHRARSGQQRRPWCPITPRRFTIATARCRGVRGDPRYPHGTDEFSTNLCGKPISSCMAPSSRRVRRIS